MKKIVFSGRTLEKIKKFPNKTKREVGFQLDKVQQGENPTDWKPMNSIASGVQEIRISESEGIYRVIYLANFEEAVYVLHAFQKKTNKTSKPDIDTAKKAYNKIIAERKQ